MLLTQDNYSLLTCTTFVSHDGSVPQDDFPVKTAIPILCRFYTAFYTSAVPCQPEKNDHDIFLMYLRQRFLRQYLPDIQHEKHRRRSRRDRVGDRLRPVYPHHAHKTRQDDGQRNQQDNLAQHGDKQGVSIAFDDPNQTKKSITDAATAWNETATASPSDGVKITYSKVGGDISLIDIDPDSGEITYKGNGSYGKVTIRATADDDPCRKNLKGLSKSAQR